MLVGVELTRPNSPGRLSGLTSFVYLLGVADSGYESTVV